MTVTNADIANLSRMGTIMQRSFGVLAIIHAALVIAQPILAGMSLEGNNSALDLHYANGMLIMMVACIQTMAALLWWKFGGGPSRAITVSLVLLIAEVIQFLLGDSGSFAIHLPLGIFVLFGALGACGMAFGDRSSRKPDGEPADG